MLVSAAAAAAYSYLFYFHGWIDCSDGDAFKISFEAAPNLLMLTLCAGDGKIRVLRLYCSGVGFEIGYGEGLDKDVGGSIPD